MSHWFEYDEDEVDIDKASGDVDICLGYSDSYGGNMYLSIPFADIRAIYEKIEEEL